MLESLDSPSATQGGENATAESISRKGVCAAWLAGAFEGEGCVFAYFKRQTNRNSTHRMTLTVGATIYNTHPLFIKRVTECLVELGIPFVCVAGKRKTDRPGVSVAIQGKGRARKFFEVLLPYLASKRQQAVLALQLIAYRETLVARNHGPKGVFQNMPLEADQTIKGLCERIKREKHEYESVFNFSRQANTIFGESSTTLRSPLGIQ